MAVRFNVGDLALLQRATFFDEYDGYPCVIRGGLALRRAVDLRSCRCIELLCYDVELLSGADGSPAETFCAAPHQLRRLGGGDADGERVPRERRLTLDG